VAVEPVDLEVRGRRIPGVRVDGRDDLAAAVRQLRLAPSRVVVLVGGASNMSDADAARVEEAAANAIVPTAERLGAAVVDGGTRVGVVKLAADARSALGARFPLVGVMPAALLADVELDERHTHFVLAPGTNWGDEVELLAAVATAIARGAATVTVLANGGDIAWDDAAASIAEGRPLLVLAGSGRTADAIAEARAERAISLHDSGLVTVVSATATDDVAAALGAALAAGRSGS
jgi:hypothetical protein